MLAKRIQLGLHELGLNSKCFFKILCLTSIF